MQATEIEHTKSRGPCLLRLFLVMTALKLLTAPVAEAGPASPLPFDAVQPDGRTITLHVRGDEFSHWFEDSNGYTVIADQGTYVYAALDPREGTLSPTGLVVGVDDPAAFGLQKRRLALA